LITVPGWGTVRAANYGAAVGDPGRWPGARQLYHASGLSPAQYESAGKRRDGTVRVQPHMSFCVRPDVLVGLGELCPFLALSGVTLRLSTAK
jgi:Transposase IS116/IS110/IS902 family